MKRVFIPINTNIPVWQQFPTEQTVWGDYEFIIGDKCDNYDILVVLDNIPKAINTTCMKNNTVLFTGEPSSVKKYPDSFIQQFGHIYSCQKELLDSKKALVSVPPLPWMLTYDFGGVTGHKYDEFNYFTPHDKYQANTGRKNKFCLLTSKKRITKAHCDRVFFAERLKKDYPDLVDIYGMGYKKMDVKYDVLSQYKYSIVIENSTYPYYITEKLADSILAGCYPIYSGAPNVTDYLNQNGLSCIDIKDYKGTVEILKKVLDSDLYSLRENEMTHNKKCVLYNINMFSIIAKALDEVDYIGSNDENRFIYPISFPKVYLIKRKISRLWYKYLYKAYWLII